MQNSFLADGLPAVPPERAPPRMIIPTSLRRPTLGNTSASSSKTWERCSSSLVGCYLFEEGLAAYHEVVHDLPLHVTLFKFLSQAAAERAELQIGQGIGKCILLPREGRERISHPQRLGQLNHQ